MIAIPNVGSNHHQIFDSVPAVIKVFSTHREMSSSYTMWPLAAPLLAKCETAIASQNLMEIGRKNNQSVVQNQRFSRKWYSMCISSLNWKRNVNLNLPYFCRYFRYKECEKNENKITNVRKMSGKFNQTTWLKQKKQNFIICARIDSRCQQVVRSCRSNDANLTNWLLHFSLSI